MISEELIKRKIRLIEEDLIKLEEIKNLSLEDYLKDPYKELIAERLLERIIGRCIDINNHFIKHFREIPPKDYYESFILMSEIGVVSTYLSKEIAFLAGLRNRLAHEYDEIDPEKVYESIQKIYELLPKYLKEIINYLRTI